MKTRWQRAIGFGATALIAGLALIQLVPVSRLNPPVESEIVVPDELESTLRRACYDCHSNETKWPWYSKIAPVSWLVAHDVEEGRRELNFSAWGEYSAQKQDKKKKETAKEVAEGEMPPWYYTAMHPRARLTESDRVALRAWSDGRKRE